MEQTTSREIRLWDAIERDAPLAEINQILRDDLGEPATCREELERAGVDPGPTFDEPWSWDALRSNYELIDVDLTRDMARGK